MTLDTKIKTLFLFWMILLAGCASIPKEVVEISYTLGKDLNAVHTSYRVLVQEYFQNLRNQTTDFLEKRWVPTYLRNFIQDGELVKRASGTNSTEVLEDVLLWAEVAVEEIQAKKKELTEPIDKDEKELLSYIDESFSQMYLANSTITSHLNSLRKVEEIQMEVLNILEVKGLKDKVNDKLILASDKAKDAIKKLEKTQKTLNELEEKKQRLLKKEN